MPRDKAHFVEPPALQCQVTRTPPSGLRGFHGVDTWGCLGADPLFIPNPGTAQVSVITCNMTPGK